MTNLNFKQVVDIIGATETTRSDYYSIFSCNRKKFVIFQNSLSSPPSCMMLDTMKLISPENLFFTCANSFNLDLFIKSNGITIPDTPDFSFTNTIDKQAVSSIILKLQPLSSIDEDNHEDCTINLSQFYYLNNEKIFKKILFSADGHIVVPMFNPHLDKPHKKDNEPTEPTEIVNFLFTKSNENFLLNPHNFNCIYLNNSFSNQNTLYLSFNPTFPFSLISQKINSAEPDFNFIQIRLANLPPKPSLEISSYFLNIMEYYNYPLIYFIHNFDIFSHFNFLQLCLNFLSLKKGAFCSTTFHDDVAHISILISENLNPNANPKFTDILNILTSSQNDFNRAYPNRDEFKITFNVFPVTISGKNFISIDSSFFLIPETCNIICKQILNYLKLDIKENSPVYNLK